MHDDYNWWEWLWSEAGRAAIAGAAGGIVRWLTLRERLWPDGLIAISTGAICALYLGEIAVPILAPVLGMVAGATAGVEQDAHQLGAFLMGMGGVTAAGFILDVWTARRRDVSNGGDSNEG